jgi:hypothetical protein
MTLVKTQRLNHENKQGSTAKVTYFPEACTGQQLPPVASKSSTMTTFCPEAIASFCISNMSCRNQS